MPAHTQTEQIIELNKQDFVILCPSRSRANIVSTRKFLSNLVLVVNADQKDEYRKYNPDCIILSPPKEVSGITPTRSWMIKTFKNIFMVDDDVIGVKRNYAESGDEQYVTDPDEVYEIVAHSFYMARQLGAKLFTFDSGRHPLEYTSHVPYGFTGYFNNSHVGFLEGHGLKYNNSYGEAEDYYISLLHAYQNRYGLIDRRFTFVTKDNFIGDGGCCEYRTEDMMIENTLRLRKTFGEAVVLKSRAHTKTSVHKGERTIKIPF